MMRFTTVSVNQFYTFVSCDFSYYLVDEVVSSFDVMSEGKICYTLPKTRESTIYIEFKQTVMLLNI